MSQDAISPILQNATKTLGIQQAIDLFGTSIPSYTAFFENKEKYCHAFHQKYPSIAENDSSQVGVIQAAWRTFLHTFTPFASVFEAPGVFPPSYEENSRLILEQGQITLQQAKEQLFKLEDLGQGSHKEQLRKLHGMQLALTACPPKEEQGLEAIQDWASQIQTYTQKIETLASQFVVSTPKKEEGMKEIGNLFKRPPSNPQELLALLFPNQIGLQSADTLPKWEQLVETLGPIGRSLQNPKMREVLQDIQKCLPIHHAFQSQIDSYAWRRFLPFGKEYQPILEASAQELSFTIKEALLEMDRKERSSFTIPFMEESRSLNPEHFFKPLTKPILFYIEPAATQGLYTLTVYSNELNPAKKLVFQNVLKEELADPFLLEDLLKRSSVLGTAQKLKSLRELFIIHYPNEPCPTDLRDLKAWECFLNKTTTASTEVVQARIEDGKRSFDAQFGISDIMGMNPTKTASLQALLETHFGSLASASSSPITYFLSLASQFQAEHHPWLVLEHLLAEKDPRFPGLFKCASIFHMLPDTLDLSQATKTKMHFAKQSFLALKEARGAEAAYLEMLEQKIAQKENALHLLEIANGGQISAAPDFSTFHQTTQIIRPVEPSKTAPQSNFSKIMIHDPLDIPTSYDRPFIYEDVDKICNQMIKFTDRLEEDYKQERYDGILLAIKELHRTFNLRNINPAAFKLRIDRRLFNHLSTLLTSLDKISTLYFKSYFDATSPRLPDAETALIMLELLAMTEIIVDKMRIPFPDTSLPLQEFYPLIFNRNLFFRIADPTLDARFKALQQYCQTRPETPPLFPALGQIPKPALGSMGTLIGGSAFDTPSFKVWMKQIADPSGIAPKLNTKLTNYLGGSTTEELARNLASGISSWGGNYASLIFKHVRRVAFHTAWFLGGGTFLKPSSFKRENDSYELSFELTKLTEAIAPHEIMFELHPSGREIARTLHAFQVTPRVKGIDNSVFKENLEVPDGHSKTHQFLHLDRVPVDPIMQSVRSLQTKEQTPLVNALLYPFLNFPNFYPGITEAGRNIYDINVLMVQEKEKLKHDLSKQQYETFLSLRGEPVMQIDNTLSFFRQNSALLEKPDFRSYFLNLLFDPGLLVQELALPARGIELEKQLADFIVKHYNLYSRTNNQEMADFYLSLATRVLQYSAWARKEYPASYQETSPPKFFELDYFQNILASAIEKAPDSSLGSLHALSAQLQLLNPSPSKEELVRFLNDVLHYHHFPPSGKVVDPLLEENLQSLLNRFAPLIAALPKDRLFFEEVLKGVAPPLGAEEECTPIADNPLLFKIPSRSMTLDLLKGWCQAPGLGKIPLPADALNHPSYTALYGSKEFLGTQVNAGTTEFYDLQENKNRLLRKGDGSYAIQRQMPQRQDQWYQYVPLNFFFTGETDHAVHELQKQLETKDPKQISWKTVIDVSASIPPKQVNSLQMLPNEHLIHGYTHWYRNSFPGELLIFNQDNQLLYRAELVGSELLDSPNALKTLKNVYRQADEKYPELALVNLYRQESALHWTKALDDPEHVLAWKDPNTHAIVLLEFPRLHLSFDVKNERFLSREFPGFRLNQLQSHPLGQRHSDFAILEDGKGKQKLILPARKPIAPSDAFGSPIVLERTSKDAKFEQKYYVYDRESIKKPFSSDDLEANLYLALLYGMGKHYPESLGLIRKLDRTMNPLKENETTLLQWIVDLDKTAKNTEPSLTAIRAKAYLLLEKNRKNHSQNTNSFSQSSTPNPAKEYFETAASLPFARLKLEEELALLEYGMNVSSHHLEVAKKLIERDPILAKTFIAQIGKNEAPDLNHILKRLSEAPSNFIKQIPEESSLLEPILPDVFRWIEKKPINEDRASIEQEMSKIFSTKGIQDPVHKHLREFYLNDFKDFIKLLDPFEYELKANAFSQDEMAHHLLSSLVEKPETEKTFTEKMGELAGVYQYVQEALPHLELAILNKASSSKQNTLELQDLLMLFKTNDLASLKVINTDLQDADIAALDQMIDLYLDLAIQNNQRGRVVEKMGAVKNLVGKQKEAELKQALELLVIEAQIKRNYEGHENRFLKIFEYHNLYYYRSNQLAMTETLGVPITKTSNAEIAANQSLVKELPVGAGKTTYVAPTVAAHNADGHHLSLVIMTEDLVKNMAPTFERILGKTYLKKLHRFKFNRNTKLNPENLDAMLHLLKHTIENKDVLIATDKDLKSFFNQFIHIYHTYVSNPTPENALKADKMWQMLLIFHDQTKALGDEADVLYALLKELNYPFGTPVNVGQHLASWVSKTYQLLIEPDILKQVSFEFVPSSVPRCTPKQYDAIVKPALVQKITALLHSPPEKFSANPAIAKLQQFYTQLGEEKQTQLTAYLAGKDENQIAQNWIEAISDLEVRDVLGLLHGEINSGLRLTLQKNANERYGYHSREEITARPFRASNTPSENSIFRDLIEEMNFTTQLLLKTSKLPPTVLSNLIQDLKNQKTKEMLDQAELIESLPPDQQLITEADKKFESYFGKRPGLHLGHPDILQKLSSLAINDPSIKFNLLETYILPQSKKFERNLQASSESLSRLFKNEKLFTGTACDADAFPKKFQFQYDPGARGRILYYVYKYAKNKVRTEKLKIGPKILNELLIKNPNYQHIVVLIDAGGVLREYPFSQASQDWMRHLETTTRSTQAVAEFDEQGKLWMCERGSGKCIPASQSRVTLDGRNTIYAQRFTRGTDLEHPLNVVALMTVSKNMNMQDFIQAVGRLRKLPAGQKLEIVMIEDDAIAIREYLGLNPDHDLTLADLYNFFESMEAQAAASNILVATRRQIKSHLQGQALNAIRNAPHISQVAAPYNHPELVNKLFFENSKIDPFIQYGRQATFDDAKTVLKKEIEDLLNKKLKLDTLLPQNRLEVLRQELYTIVDGAKLPEKISTIASDAGIEEEQEIEQEAEEEIEQETEEEMEEHLEEQQQPNLEKPGPHQLWQNIGPHNVQDLNTYIDPKGKPQQLLHSLNDAAFPYPIFDSELMVSSNFLVSSNSQVSPQSFNPFSNLMKPLQNIAILKDEATGQLQCLLLEPYDAAIIKTALHPTILEKDGSTIVHRFDPKYLPISKDPDFISTPQEEELRIGFMKIKRPPRAARKYPDFFSELNDWSCITPEPCLLQPLEPISNRLYPQQQKGQPVQIWMGDLEGITHFESSPPMDLATRQSPQFLRLLVQAKFYNGDVSYKKEEIPVLKNWMKDAAIRIQTKSSTPLSKKECLDWLEQTFRQFVILSKEQSRRDYEGSSLEIAFKQVREEL